MDRLAVLAEHGDTCAAGEPARAHVAQNSWQFRCGGMAEWSNSASSGANSRYRSFFSMNLRQTVSGELGTDEDVAAVAEGMGAKAFTEPRRAVGVYPHFTEITSERHLHVGSTRHRKRSLRGAAPHAVRSLDVSGCGRVGLPPDCQPGKPDKPA